MTDHRNDDEIEQPLEGLSGSAVEAPDDVLKRFRKRATIVQGTRVLLEKQIFGFWVVLNTFLKLIFKRFDAPVEPVAPELARRYRDASRQREDERL